MELIKNIISKYEYAIKVQSTGKYIANGNTDEITTSDISLAQTYRHFKTARGLWTDLAYDVVKVENTISEVENG